MSVRAVRSTGDGVRVVAQDEPPGVAEGVEVEVVAASICGTDLGLVDLGPLDFVLGHELAGRFEGRPVAIEPKLWCGRCEQCDLGATQRCTGASPLLGYFHDGGMADVVRVPRSAIIELPAGLRPADACLVEPLAVALHGTRQGALLDGMAVGVIGAGTIGLALTACLRDAGILATVEARHAHQRDAAERLGGRPGTVGAADVVFEATGSAGGVARAIEAVRPGGRVVLLSVFHDLVPLPGLPVLVKEVQVVGSSIYGRRAGRRETAEAAELLSRSDHIAETLITHRFPLDDAAAGFATARSRSTGVRKVVLEP